MTIVTWEDYWRLKNRLVLIYETALIKKKHYLHSKLGLQKSAGVKIIQSTYPVPAWHIEQNILHRYQKVTGNQKRGKHKKFQRKRRGYFSQNKNRINPPHNIIF